MTNATIVMDARLRLLDEGKIKPTGRMYKLITDEGERLVPEPEEIHTYAKWQELGYQVKRGSKAITMLMIWKYSEKKKKSADEEEEKTGNMFLKGSYFFAAHQVEPKE